MCQCPLAKSTRKPEGKDFHLMPSIEVDYRGPEQGRLGLGYLNPGEQTEYTAQVRKQKL